jgi:hypothetical protein
MPKVRENFEILAHLAIKELSEESMAELFDLTIMGLKHNVLLMTDPKEILLFTRTRLLQMKALIKDCPVEKIITQAFEFVGNACKDYSAFDWLMIRK